MDFLLLLTMIVIACVFSFIAGASWSEWDSMKYWKLHKFCVTCNRLDCPREHDILVRDVEKL